MTISQSLLGAGAIALAASLTDIRAIEASPPVQQATWDSASTDGVQLVRHRRFFRTYRPGGGVFYQPYTGYYYNGYYGYPGYYPGDYYGYGYGYGNRFYSRPYYGYGYRPRGGVQIGSFGVWW